MATCGVMVARKLLDQIRLKARSLVCELIITITMAIEGFKDSSRNLVSNLNASLIKRCQFQCSNVYNASPQHDQMFSRNLCNPK